MHMLMHYVYNESSDISMVKYYLLFLSLVERKKCCNGTKNHGEKKTACASALQIKQK